MWSIIVVRLVLNWSMSAYKTQLQKHSILVLPLHKVLAIARTIVKLTDTNNTCILKMTKGNCDLLSTLSWNSKFDIHHSYLYNANIGTTDSLLSIYIYMSRSCGLKNGYIQWFQCGTFLIFLNISNLYRQRAIFKLLYTNSDTYN